MQQSELCIVLQEQIRAQMTLMERYIIHIQYMFLQSFFSIIHLKYIYIHIERFFFSILLKSVENFNKMNCYPTKILITFFCRTCVLRMLCFGEHICNWMCKICTRYIQYIFLITWIDIEIFRKTTYCYISFEVPQNCIWKFQFDQSMADTWE